MESFRAEFTLMERTPVDSPSVELTRVLDLSCAKLRYLDLSPYLGLERLRCGTQRRRVVG